MFLLLIFLTIICETAAQDIVVYERFKTSECLTADKLFPPSYPSIGLRYSDQSYPVNSPESNPEYVGMFTAVLPSRVSFDTPLMRETIVNTPDNTTCDFHPAFGYGYFITVPGPIIVTLERKSTIQDTNDPVPIKCSNEFERRQPTTVWYVNAYPNIQRTPLTACPQSGNTLYLIQNGNISSIEFGVRTYTPTDIGCFDDTSSIFQNCDPTTHRRYCVPDASCSLPDLSSVSVRLGLFKSQNLGIIESIRIVSDNVFPFDITPTAPPVSTSDAWVTVPVSFWFILFLTMINYI